MKITLPLLLAFTVLATACSSSEDNSSPAAAGDEPSVPSSAEPVSGEADAEPAPDVPSDPSEPAPDADSEPEPDPSPSPEPLPTPEVSPGAGDDASGSTAEDVPTASSPVPDADSPVTLPVEPPIEPPEPIQPGSLTAGDYDDQLNPWLYQQYSDNYLQNVRPQANIPRLDLSNRVAVIIKDNSNRPYAGASVELLGEQGNTVSRLVTPANGITYLYEDLDGLGSEFTLKIGDRLGDVSMMQTVQLDSIGRERQLEFTLATPNVAVSQLDLQLVIDTTGSMGDELNYLQTELSSILNSIQSTNPQVSIRTGLVVYRDVGDQYVVRSYPFTDNAGDMQAALNGETFDGGGDYPEAMDQALAEALSFEWREQSAKISLLVADAPPHSDRVNATWQSALAARSKQIHIVPLAASGVAEDAEYLMRSMAALTNSRYLFLTDDSGLGNSHAEPQVDCYVVTRLDGLIKRVINQVITGERSEPSDNEIIREVGSYDDGVCDADQQ